MTYEEQQKGCESNRLVSGNGGIHYACIINIIKIFPTLEMDFSQWALLKSEISGAIQLTVFQGIVLSLKLSGQ